MITISNNKRKRKITGDKKINHNIYMKHSPVNNEMCFIHNGGFHTIFKLCSLQELNDIFVAYKSFRVSKN